ncbi:MAG: VWA domain-containing protein [Myxococcales bacterium]|nr:VWA domain-containing protein [Myxococcales bacterium]
MSRGLLVSAALAICAGSPSCVQDAKVGSTPLPSTDDSGLLDILFVVDSSASMREKQVLLTQEIEILIDQLPAPPGGALNVHIGVISPDMGAGSFGINGCEGVGDDGALQPGDDSCDGPTDLFIEHIFGAEGTRETNYQGTFEDAFACTAAVGTAGCGFEQPLAAMRRGLEQLETNSSNDTAFLRADADLAVIFVTDEDDCSVHDASIFDPDPSQDNITSELGPFSGFRCIEFGLTCDGALIGRSAETYADCAPRENSPYLAHPDTYIDYLSGLKTDVNDVVVAVIAGGRSGLTVSIEGDRPTGDASCESEHGGAFPAFRLGYFAEQFPNHLVRSICEPTLRGPMMEIGVLLRSVIEMPSP